MSTIYDDLESEIPSGAFVWNDLDADVDISGPKYWGVYVGDDYPLNIVALVTALTAGILQVYKDPTTNVAGTALTAQLMDQNASLTPDSTAEYDPTNSGDGTLVYQQQIPAGYQEVPLPKMIFEKGTTYLLKLTTIADNNKASLRLVCAEDQR